MKVLVELRAALDGHSGIPQEVRLLFRGLARLDDVDVIGLIQSSNLVVEPGLPMRRGKPVAALTDEATIDRLSKVVVSLQQGSEAGRVRVLKQRTLKVLGPAAAALGSLCGGHAALGRFEPERFKDFLWRSLFAKSLPEDDFDAVTSCAYRVLRWPYSGFHAIGVLTGNLGHATYPRLDTTGIDVMVAETPFPGRVACGTALVVRYHDAIPLLMPHTIKARHHHRAAHYRALVRNARDGAWFACVSDATRQDLLSVLPGLADRTVTIPNMVSHHFFEEETRSERVPEVVWSRKNRRVPGAGGAPVAEADLVNGELAYLLIVGTIEPRKNHLGLLDAWELLRSTGHAKLNLVVVGSLGWDHGATVERFTPWLQRGGLHLLENVPAADLRLLYRHARVTVCPSFGEGFDFPGIEAMRCGGVVAASDIAVHRGVFGDACEYFNAYSTAGIAACLDALLRDDAGPRRAELVRAGASKSREYLPDRVMPQWQSLLHDIAAG